MDKELSGIEEVKYRMDDILVIGRDQVGHDQRLKQVLEKASGEETHAQSG